MKLQHGKNVGEKVKGQEERDKELLTFGYRKEMFRMVNYYGQ